MLKKYKDVQYIVTVGPLGSLVAYVRIPEGHRFYKTEPEVCKVKLSEDHEFECSILHDNIDIPVHGGITFSTIVKDENNNYPQRFTPGYWVGWDYAHLGDYVPRLDKGEHHYGSEHLWNGLEVEEDCKVFIDRLLSSEENCTCYACGDVMIKNAEGGAYTCKNCGARSGLSGDKTYI
jgi:hypothetical protein